MDKEEIIRTLELESDTLRAALATERARSQALREATAVTIASNLGLADGDNCTLKPLKDALAAYDDYDAGQPVLHKCVRFTILDESGEDVGYTERNPPECNISYATDRFRCAEPTCRKLFCVRDGKLVEISSLQSTLRAEIITATSLQASIRLDADGTTMKPISELTPEKLRVECGEHDGLVKLPGLHGHKSREAWEREGVKYMPIVCGGDAGNFQFFPHYTTSRDAVIEAVLRKDVQFKHSFANYMGYLSISNGYAVLLPAIEYARAFAAVARKQKEGEAL